MRQGGLNEGGKLLMIDSRGASHDLDMLPWQFIVLLKLRSAEMGQVRYFSADDRIVRIWPERYPT